MPSISCSSTQVVPSRIADAAANVDPVRLSGVAAAAEKTARADY